MNLEGKSAVVTGSTKGIGRAIAEALVREGANVCVSARDEGEVEQTVAGLNEIDRGRAAGAVCDVRDYEQVRALFEHAVAEFGGVDVLVNNAGVGHFGRVDEMPPETFRAVLETNLFGVFYCCRLSVPLMKQRGGGYIINISSLAGANPHPEMAAYNASKFALNAISDALRVEVAGRGISVTTVYPGTTRTAFRENSRRTKSEKRGWRPKGVTPERVAERIARAAEKGGRDVYVTIPDRLFVTGTMLAPGLFDLVLRSWARG